MQHFKHCHGTARWLQHDDLIWLGHRGGCRDTIFEMAAQLAEALGFTVASGTNGCNALGLRPRGWQCQRSRPPVCAWTSHDGGLSAQIPSCLAASSFMISSAPPPIIITFTSRYTRSLTVPRM